MYAAQNPENPTQLVRRNHRAHAQKIATQRSWTLVQIIDGHPVPVVAAAKREDWEDDAADDRDTTPPASQLAVEHAGPPFLVQTQAEIWCGSDELAAALFPFVEQMLGRDAVVVQKDRIDGGKIAVLFEFPELAPLAQFPTMRPRAMPGIALIKFTQTEPFRRRKLEDVQAERAAAGLPPLEVEPLKTAEPASDNASATTEPAQQ